MSKSEKNEAKSLLRKLLGSKAAGSMLGASAQSPRREVFHGIERYIDFKVALDQGPIGRSAKPAKLSDLRTRKTERNCHVSSNPRLHRAPATDSRRPADPTSRMGRATWRILHAPHGTARQFHANGIQRVCSCYLSRPRTGNWKVKTYGTCFNASCLLLVLSGDHLLRRLAYRSYARQMTVDTSTVAAELVIVAATILTFWHNRSKS